MEVGGCVHYSPVVGLSDTWLKVARTGRIDRVQRTDNEGIVDKVLEN